ncbi:hypothetical protein ABT160_19980 [Streptomyces sp. NPDC001941]|uniref:hypothetical protein n=1 Tax=Streptomyces sp. NPDC001941 TaxID=3154659 RepID=UPI0033319541
MNSLKGLGVIALLAGLAYGLTRVADTDQLLFAFSVTVVALCLFGYAASIRRRRRDERLAAGTGAV